MLPDNNILDILISIVLIYALLSILVSTLLEWWNQKRKARAKFLKQVILLLLKDPLNVHYGELFYSHYLIAGLKNKELKTAPQYISSRLFAEVLIDIVANRKLHDKPVILKATGDTGKQYEFGVVPMEQDVKGRFESELKTMHPSPFSDSLKSFWDKSDGNLEKLRVQLSFWFDDYMDRVSGWYKKKQRIKFLVFGFIVTVALNVDSLHLIKVLSIDDTLRSELVAAAERVADQYNNGAHDSTGSTNDDNQSANDGDDDCACRKRKPCCCPEDSVRVTNVRYAESVAANKLKADMSINNSYMHKVDSVLGVASSLDIPIGWDDKTVPLIWFYGSVETSNEGKVFKPRGNGALAYTYERNQFTFGNLVYYLFGLAISTVALSFGAPFWFETLVKVVNIRRAGKKPEPVNEK